MGRPAAAWRGAGLVVVSVLLAVSCWLLVQPAWADRAAEPLTYRCDGTLLTATLHRGAVDDPSSPNSTGGTLPGAYVVLQSSGLNLQLPRTNNAGAPSFTDGKWWWSLEDPDHPRFLLRRGLGDIESLACERDHGSLTSSSGP
jgi:hypothetical protein